MTCCPGSKSVASSAKRALFTFGEGAASEWLNITRPSLQDYAAAQAWDFYDQPIEHATMPLAGRPESWWKLSTALSLFDSGYTDILWVDADCVAFDPTFDVWPHVPADKPFGVVIHKRPHFGKLLDIPNCGVLALRPAGVPFLRAAWEQTQFIRNPWWEQASICSLLGMRTSFPCYLPDEETRAKNPWWQYVAFLPPIMNLWPSDGRWQELVSSSVIRHAAGVKPAENRTALLRQWASERPMEKEISDARKHLARGGAVFGDHWRQRLTGNNETGCC